MLSNKRKCSGKGQNVHSSEKSNLSYGHFVQSFSPIESTPHYLPIYADGPTVQTYSMNAQNGAFKNYPSG